MSTILRTLLTCGDCGHSGNAIWNSANNPSELVRVPSGFSHMGRGQGGEEYFICTTCRRPIADRSHHSAGF